MQMTLNANRENKGNDKRAKQDKTIGVRSQNKLHWFLTITFSSIMLSIHLHIGTELHNKSVDTVTRLFLMLLSLRFPFFLPCFDI